MNVSPLQVALIALIVAAIWAVVELALTLRTSRSKVEKLSEEMENTLQEVQPVVQKLDGIADEIGPAIKKAEPIMDQADLAMNVLTQDLNKVNSILGDVSQLTGIASGVSTQVTKTASAVGNAAHDFISSLTRKGDDTAKVLGNKTVASLESEEDKLEKERQELEDELNTKRQYFTYPDTTEE